MQSTDRPQVRELIEMLQRFDPKARVAISRHTTGVTNGDIDEILGVTKGQDTVVYLEAAKSDELVNLEDECNKLEDANENLDKENQELKNKLGRFEEAAKKILTT